IARAPRPHAVRTHRRLRTDAERAAHRRAVLRPLPGTRRRGSAAVTAPLSPGTQVLRLHLAGVLDLAIPHDLVEDGPGWDAWFDGALAAVFEDGRWADAASIVRSEVGYLDEDG